MDEHEAMLSCPHSEADAIGPVCISCGRVSFDPSYAFIAFAVCFFAAQVARWLW